MKFALFSMRAFRLGAGGPWVRRFTMLKEAVDAKPVKEGFIKNAIQAAEDVALAGLKVEKLKARAATAIEDGMVDAKRMVKRGVYAAEDLIDDTEYRIKKDPFASVGITFGAGIAVGAFLGWLITYKTRPRVEN